MDNVKYKEFILNYPLLRINLFRVRLIHKMVSDLKVLHESLAEILDKIEIIFKVASNLEVNGFSVLYLAKSLYLKKNS